MSSPPTEIALSVFRTKPYSLGCGQSVFRAFEGASSSMIKPSKKWSHGKSKGGLCGSLKAGLHLRPDLEAVLMEAFIEKGGSTLCSELRAKNDLSCKGCVSLTCQILEAHNTSVVQ
eukprot:gnl/Dysnectes_brevis/587_a649_6303.p1 GENE.gnl/Dysnectes_brevis/587_a649_6303~~gnl/Dysnectes_brevis/587_a649_6303.p1  ORF type:complete len:116 (+),score=3.79 gnl/Dysnectes_brevis/587_a649_6303:45-392(+)